MISNWWEPTKSNSQANQNYGYWIQQWWYHWINFSGARTSYTKCTAEHLRMHRYPRSGKSDTGHPAWDWKTLSVGFVVKISSPGINHYCESKQWLHGEVVMNSEHLRMWRWPWQEGRWSNYIITVIWLW